MTPHSEISTNTEVQAFNTALEPITLRIEGMTDASCVTAIEKTLNSIPGVRASVNFAKETAHVMVPAELNPKQLIIAIKSAGYSATQVADPNQVALHNKSSATALFFALLFTAPVLAISTSMNWHPAIDRWINGQLANFNFSYPKYSPTAWLTIGLSAPVVLIVAIPIYRAGIRNLFHPTMDTLVTLGSLTAFGWSIYSNITGNGDVYAEVSATIITLVVAGRFLEAHAKGRATNALSALLKLGSKEVIIIREGELIQIPIDHLKVGDHFIAKPGEQIAADGVVISGESAVDNSLLTGESSPVNVTPGALVIASSINANGHLVIRATRVGSDTELARITAMVINAQGNKAPIQRMADSVNAVFVPVVILLALGTYSYWHYSGHSLTQSISNAIAVLVIACPCALGLATPVALLVASGRGAQRGIIIRQPRVLEVARKLDTVILDKTGTLTDGRMSLATMHVEPLAGQLLGNDFHDLLREEVILSSALSIELQSDHPVAAAIAISISRKGIKPSAVTEFSSTPGSGSAGRVNLGTQSPVVLIGSPTAVAHATTPFHQGLTHEIFQAQSKGLTVSVLAWDGVALAMFAVGDEVKSDAKKAVTEFKAQGMVPWLMTGDGSQMAISIAKEVGIAADHVISGALPQEKVEKVLSLQAKGHRVLMVGDGVSDAAAMAGAEISIAMGTGTDTAIATADIVLMRRDLGGVTDALNLSSKTRRVIRGNLAWAFLYNAVGIPVAAVGALRPIYAAGAMAASSLFVITNSLRIK